MEITISEMTLEDIISIENDFSENFDKFWSIEILKNDFSNPLSKYFVAKYLDEVVGFAGIKIVMDTADIMNIVTKKVNRNLGIGSILLKHIIQYCQNFNCISIDLEVNENNLPAIHLYEKYNFKRIGLRKKYYNNTDNAILMELKLNQGGTNEK